MRVNLRWSAAGVLVAAALATGSAQAAPASTGRLAGATRYDTAVAISEATFPTGSPEVVIARGDLFPDALVASFLASLYNGRSPVLLTEQARLPAGVAAEIRRLGASRAWIMGDTSAVSAQVEASIRSVVRDVRRISGATRYDTSFAATGVIGEARDHAFVVSGEDYPDALAAGWLANRASMPVILTTSGALHPAARRALEQIQARHVYVVGGTKAVSDAVVAELRAMRSTPSAPTLEVTRVSGADRFATAVAVADLALGPPFDLPLTHVNLATGRGFADAVAGGPHGGSESAPTLFVASPDDLGETTRAWLRAHAAAITSLHALGDAGVVSDAVLADAAAAAD